MLLYWLIVVRKISLEWIYLFFHAWFLDFLEIMDSEKSRLTFLKLSFSKSYVSLFWVYKYWSYRKLKRYEPCPTLCRYCYKVGVRWLTVCWNQEESPTYDGPFEVQLQVRRCYLACCLWNQIEKISVSSLLCTSSSYEWAPSWVLYSCLG